MERIFPEERGRPGRVLRGESAPAYLFQCNSSDSGQNGRTDGAGDGSNDPDRLPWVDLEDLRVFLRDWVDERNLRDAEKETGIGHEGIRKFIDGSTQRLHNRTRKAYTALMVREQARAAALAEQLAEGLVEQGDSLPAELRMVLPPGLEAGLAALEKIFELAARHPEELPACADEVRAWNERQVRLEYARPAAAAEYRKRKKPRKPSADKPEDDEG